MNELDQAKQEILQLKQKALDAPPGAIASVKSALPMPESSPAERIFDRNLHKIEMEYTLEDIKSRIEVDSVYLSKKKKQIQDEMLLTKQLLANIHKNRLGVSQQLLDGDSSLSYSRKLAISSLKTKLDEQSTKIQKNEDMICD